MSGLLPMVRRGATLPLVRRLTEVTPVIRVTGAMRGTLVRERAAFARNELRRRPRTAVYTLRSSGLRVAVRHHTSDVITLDEVFSGGDYELPAEVRAALAARARPLDVLDLGANAGYFGAWLLGLEPDARIVGYEPDPANAAAARQTIAANGGGAEWTLVEAASGCEDGSLAFVTGEGAASRRAEGSEEGRDVVPVRDVFPDIARADFVKIDIEGGEWPILADARLGTDGPAALVVEHHPQGCPAPDPSDEAERLLRLAGFEVLRPAAKAAEPGVGVLWGWRG